MDKYDALKLENQLCFPLYAASREVIKLYRPYLQALDLTYTQYVAMLVLWEEGSVSVRDLGHKLHLDSGTLTPVLKSLESKGFLKRYRCSEDERVLIVELTAAAEELKEKAVSIPAQIAGCVRLEGAEAMQLYELLYKLMDNMKTE